MTVILTSQVEGKQPGDKYTGPNEAFLLANGYARRDKYSGPGVKNDGPADVKPAKDPRLSENREDEANVDLGTFQAARREGAPELDEETGDAGTPDGPVTEEQEGVVAGQVDEARADGGNNPEA